jgi:hypothetical protein
MDDLWSCSPFNISIEYGTMRFFLFPRLKGILKEKILEVPEFQRYSDKW